MSHCDSLFAWKEDHCLISNENINISNRIFGADWIDIADIRKSMWVVNDKGEKLYPAQFVRSIFAENADVPFRCENGEPAVICNTYGKGKAIRYATDVFRSYLKHDMTGAMEVIKDFLPCERKNTVWLANGDEALRMHVLAGKQKKMLVLLNYSEEEKTPVLCGCEDCVLTDAKTGQTAQNITVSPRDVRILICEKN